MEEFELSDTLSDYLNNSYHPDKVRAIRNCFYSISELIANKYPANIDLDEFNSRLDDIIYNIETLGKENIVIAIDSLILGYIIDSLDTIGITIDKERHFEFGYGYTVLYQILHALNILLEPDVDLAETIVKSWESEPEEDIEWLSELIAINIADSHPLIYYEIIEELNNNLIDAIVNNARLALFKYSPTINNNLLVMLNNLLKSVDNNYLYIDTFIVKDIVNNNRDVEAVDDNIDYVLSKLLKHTELDVNKVAVEIAVAILFSDEYISKDLNKDYINEINFEVLTDLVTNIQQLKDEIYEILDKVKV